MKSTNRVRVLCALALLSAVACSNADEEKAKITAIQKEADDRVAVAERSAKERVEAAQKALDALKSEYADASAHAKADAENALREAKENADEEEKAALAAIAKARGAYKEEARVKLGDLAKDVHDVSQKAAKAPAKLKPVVDKSMKEIALKEQAIGKEISAFDTATLDTFKTVKAKLEKDLAELKASIQKLKSKLP